jgi:hypothetical protein
LPEARICHLFDQRRHLTTTSAAQSHDALRTTRRRVCNRHGGR